jgi:hypothetical protein
MPCTAPLENPAMGIGKLYVEKVVQRLQKDGPDQTPVSMKECAIHPAKMRIV